MTDYEGELRHVRRLSRLLGMLTILLLIVLGLYIWPLVRDRFFPSTSARPITPRGDLMDIEKTTIAICKKASLSVVFIATDTSQVNLNTRSVSDVPQGSGSGFIWDEQGHIVTNYHVIQSATAFHVVLSDQSAYDAELIGYDQDHDLAVLKINPSLGVKLLPIPIGTSHDLQVGQFVFAIGNPFGLDQTVTTGIISALNQTINRPGEVEIHDVIQTDAAINPGNSGGTLLDSAARLVGIDSAIYSESGAWTGIGFAIPVDTANRVVPQIIAHGKYQRAHIGITLDERLQRVLPQILPGIQGVAIAAVSSGSPAETAHIAPVALGSSFPRGGGRFGRGGGVIARYNGGDVITKVNGKNVKNTSDYYDILDKTAPGTAITLTLWNSGETRQVQVTTQ